MELSPIISCIIPCYNAQETIAVAIESVRMQTISNWELIIVDDGSTDGSKDIIESFVNKDSRIKYFYQNNSGVSAARNNGVKLAAGEYITFLDADDWISPSCFKTGGVNLLKIRGLGLWS